MSLGPGHFFMANAYILLGVCMVFINKKRLGFVFLALIVSVVSFSLRSRKDVVSVSSLPVINKVVVLDAGHGFPDEGN